METTWNLSRTRCPISAVQVEQSCVCWLWWCSKVACCLRMMISLSKAILMQLLWSATDSSRNKLRTHACWYTHHLCPVLRTCILSSPFCHLTFASLAFLTITGCTEAREGSVAPQDHHARQGARSRPHDHPPPSIFYTRAHEYTFSHTHRVRTGSAALRVLSESHHVTT
jgi:hypothetical protein